MEFSEPTENGFTVYSKSGCPNCSKIKKRLKDKKAFFIEIDCDEYLIEHRDSFLSFIEHKVGKPYKTFPIVFNDGTFIGGYSETIVYLDTLFLSFGDI